MAPWSMRGMVRWQRSARWKSRHVRSAKGSRGMAPDATSKNSSRFQFPLPTFHDALPLCLFSPRRSLSTSWILSSADVPAVNHHQGKRGRDFRKIRRTEKQTGNTPRRYHSHAQVQWMVSSAAAYNMQITVARMYLQRQQDGGSRWLVDKQGFFLLP